MSATPETLEQSRLELEEKILKIANLQADTTLKQIQSRFEPWKVIASAVGAAGVVFGAAAAVGVFVARSFGH